MDLLIFAKQVAESKEVQNASAKMSENIDHSELMLLKHTLAY